MTKKELELLLNTLEEANRTDVGNHWLPERYASDLSKSIRVVKRELKKKKSATTES